ncbi:MAG: FemAB family XrtA/PEP-CTERM system-associated protein, partial [Terriglobales bacterium]
AYHSWRWKRVLEASFGWPTYYWMAEREDGTVCGVLPMVWQKSVWFGSFLTSLPFVNYAGIAAESPDAEQLLAGRAATQARELGVRHVELRHRFSHALGAEWTQRSHRVAVVKTVQPDTEKMWNELPNKVRTDVRKAMKSNLEATAGGAESLDDYYRVFAENMRDLGTPVYSRSFFAEILSTFPQQALVNVIRHEGKAVAASFLFAFRDSLEVPWSSSLREYLPMQPNMLLYWKNLCLAGEKGYARFDFGRSPVGSGTHRFKMQWGSEESPLPWDYWLPAGASLPELNAQNPKYELAKSVWRRLPLAVTKVLGPRIVRCLP